MENGNNFLDRWLQDLKQNSWQSFVYLSDSPDRKMSEKDRYKMNDDSGSELSTLSLSWEVL